MSGEDEELDEEQLEGEEDESEGQSSGKKTFSILRQVKLNFSV